MADHCCPTRADDAMNPATRNRKRPKKSAAVRCAGAMCGCCELAVSATDAFDRVLFCSDCHDVVHGSGDNRPASTDDLFWFVTHVDHGVIAGSNRPDIIPPTPPPLGPTQHYCCENSESIATAAEFLAKASNVLVIAGAGASIDSGLPDFRGRDGWYSMGNGGGRISMDHVDFHPSSPHLLEAWKFKVLMSRAFGNASPHSGYTELVASLFGQSPNADEASRHEPTQRQGCDNARAEEASSLHHPLPLVDRSSAFVMTSNIDGYFERAGVPPEALYETHGTMHRFQCTCVGTADEPSCPNSGALWELEKDAIKTLEAKVCSPTRAEGAAALTLGDLPRCKGCGALARPNVSHTTDHDEDLCPLRKTAQRANLVSWIERAKRRAAPLVVLEIGCGVSEHSLRLDSELVVARHRGAGGDAFLIRIDPGEPSVPAGEGHIGVRLGAEEAVTKIISAARERKGKGTESSVRP